MRYQRKTSQRKEAEAVVVQIFHQCLKTWRNVWYFYSNSQPVGFSFWILFSSDSIREDLCGFIEILPEAEPLEIRPSPLIPPNITLPTQNEDALRERRIIAGGASLQCICICKSAHLKFWALFLITIVLQERSDGHIHLCLLSRPHADLVSIKLRVCRIRPL